MANPPYSGSVLILKENQDGINVRLYHYSEVVSGTPIPRGVPGLEQHLFNSLDQTNDYYAERMVTTRANLKTAFAQYIDARFPDTP